MISTFVIGKTVNGSKAGSRLGLWTSSRWKPVRYFTALALAKYLSRNDTDFTRPRSQMIAAGLCFCPSCFHPKMKPVLHWCTFLSCCPCIVKVFLRVSHSGCVAGVLLVITLLFPPQTLIIVMTIVVALVMYGFKEKDPQEQRDHCSHCGYLARLCFIRWGSRSVYVQACVPEIPGRQNFS